ncbi:Hint domain-containing protein [Pseudobacteriovorax antillogorgiicola]|uniref:Intein N-terminal splicing region n=1 Tax=Pseudobacteriovorax antillogorgiicola TaxID=1513793 RepID=A0A1Y6CXF2_9BACT|nr:Hint domain-containing protein [Pseudobacteriovorax antillogorgiicola]TCS40919.1 intein [Pseudobacteriovorax antillogorgiicola]SMF83975.1 intein N-terminal splicing region [Pseudobacteriovorax antillogorgiicola]
MKWGHQESGASQLGMIIGMLLVGGVAGKFAIDQSSEMSVIQQKASLNSEQSLLQESAVSSLGVVKVLFQYNNGEPALYASDYFSNKWTLVDNSASNSTWKLQDDSVQLKSLDAGDTQFDQVFVKDGQSLTMQNQVKIVDLLVEEKPPFEFRYKAIVESTAQDENGKKRKLMAVIDLPDPPSPSVELTGAPPSTYATPFLGSEATLSVLVTGLATSGSVFVNGQLVETLDMSGSKNHKSNFKAGELTLLNTHESSTVVKLGMCHWKEPNDEPVEYDVRVEVKDVNGDTIVLQEKLFMKQPSNYAASVAKCPSECKKKSLVWRNGDDDRFVENAIACLSAEENGNVGQDSFMYSVSAPACKPKFLQQRSECGCFAEGTQILMADGSHKNIVAIKAGDRIWNPVTQKPMAIAFMTSGEEPIPLLKINVQGKELSVTGNHPFPTPQGILPAYELTEGSQIRVGETWTKVDTIEIQKSTSKPIVWNIMIQAGSDLRDHMLMANGIVTGDLLIQSKLEQGLLGQDRPDFLARLGATEQLHP